MQNITEYINEHREDLTRQVIMIMGTPGCGKTYWMQHNGAKFFKSLGIILNAKELDVDHTLKKHQIKNFPKFCERVLNYGNTSVMTDDGESIHGKKQAWSTFIAREQEQFETLNKKNGGNDSNVPDLSKLDYNFCAPYISRYENAQPSAKKSILNDFVKAMNDKYFNDVFASDFSVRDDCKEEYNANLKEKIAKGDSDVFVAISGAKMKTIDEICRTAPEKTTVRIVFLNGSKEKAIYQDSKRDRSGGAEFVRSYHDRIQNVWNELVDTYKDKNIYCMYEFKDANEKDTESFPAWKLTKKLN